MRGAALIQSALIAAVSWLSATPAPAAPPAELPSVVSIDYCADQYVLSLADSRQIRGVSPRARQAFSYHRTRALDVDVVEPTSEAILHTTPDLVVRFWGGNRRLFSMLERTGVDSVSVTYGHDAETIFSNLSQVAAALGRTPQAEALIAEQRRRIAALEAKPRLGLKALYLTPSGTTGGTGTDVDAMIRLAGLDNMAEQLGYAGWRTIALEQLVGNPPDVFVGSFFDDDRVARSSWSPSRHSRLSVMMDEVTTLAVPGRFLSCSGLFSVDAAEYIRAALEPGS